jgi:hypothetical protein
MLNAQFVEPQVMERGIIYVYDPKCNIAYPVSLLRLMQLANEDITQEDLDAILDEFKDCLV